MKIKDKIIAEIKKVYDPEIPVNIYDLGLIYNIEIKNENDRTQYYQNVSNQIAQNQNIYTRSVRPGEDSLKAKKDAV